ncbi:MAG: hypothetical protein NTW33_06655 [Methanoregula sp.]|nr:hypothetical protein [Methanoregula sp.]
MILFTLWFGGYGAVAAYVGTFIGAGVLSGMPPAVIWYWSLAGLWQVMIPLVALRMLNGDVRLGKRRDIIIFVIFGILVNNAFGALWGAVTLALGNEIAWAQGYTGIFCRVYRKRHHNRADCAARAPVCDAENRKIKGLCMALLGLIKKIPPNPNKIIFSLTGFRSDQSS